MPTLPFLDRNEGRDSLKTADYAKREVAPLESEVFTMNVLDSLATQAEGIRFSINVPLLSEKRRMENLHS